MKNLILIPMLLLASTVYAQLKLKQKEPPQQMQTLQFLAGKWHSDEGEWFDDEGNLMKVERDQDAPELPGLKTKPYEIAPIMGGLYLEGGADGDAVRAYFYYHEAEGEYYHLAIDFMGSTSIMTGDWQGGNLVLKDIKTQKHPKGGTILWKRTFYDIGKNSYSFTYEYSRDEGRTWNLRGRQTMNRADS